MKYERTENGLLMTTPKRICFITNNQLYWNPAEWMLKEIFKKKSMWKFSCRPEAYSEFMEKDDKHRGMEETTI